MVRYGNKLLKSVNLVTWKRVNKILKRSVTPIFYFIFQQVFVWSFKLQSLNKLYYLEEENITLTEPNAFNIVRHVKALTNILL